jgi:hypothetical protein
MNFKNPFEIIFLNYSIQKRHEQDFYPGAHRETNIYGLKSLSLRSEAFQIFHADQPTIERLS